MTNKLSSKLAIKFKCGCIYEDEWLDHCYEHGDHHDISAVYVGKAKLTKRGTRQ